MATKQENLDFLISVNALGDDSKVADFTADELNLLVENYKKGALTEDEPIDVKEVEEEEEGEEGEGEEVVEDDTVMIGSGRNEWVLICKTSSESRDFIKTTRALKVSKGVLVQVTDENSKGISVAISYIPDARIISCPIEKCSYIV